MQALILCHDDDRYKDIQELTRSIVFMGTPHEGSDQAKNLKIAQKLFSLVGGSQDTTTITKELEAYSTTTMDINKSFMRKASQGLILLCFFETQPTRLPQGDRVVSSLLGPPGKENNFANPMAARRLCIRRRQKSTATGLGILP